MAPSLNSSTQSSSHSYTVGFVEDIPPETQSIASGETEESLDDYIKLLDSTQISSGTKQGTREEIITAPLFSWQAKQHAEHLAEPVQFRQYALIGQELASVSRSKSVEEVKPIFLNTDAPWSAFLCGSQGSGKSYTLSCILENCLLSERSIGRLPQPMAGILFHYDPHNTSHACEAAYLSSHIHVTVLVSPSNFWAREELYNTISAGNIKVKPLLLQDRHLNVHRMRKLMAFNESDGSIPLYMEVILRILREMATDIKGGRGLGYQDFLRRLNAERELSTMQKGPMNLRLQLLDAFMADNKAVKKKYGLSKNFMAEDPFQTMPGTLTIVDLSDPFIDSQAACSLFDMCLALFLENDSKVGRVIALDEAHKFMTSSDASNQFTESLLQLIREQRHKGARIVISTQEPTISPSLLDLCSMTFVHRFTSPAWLTVLRGHLAGAAEANAEGSQHSAKRDLMDDIINLKVGESLLFCPSAMVEMSEPLDDPRETSATETNGWLPVNGKETSNGVNPSHAASIRKLGMQHLHFRTRPRLTGDGGRSILASTGVTR